MTIGDALCALLHSIRLFRLKILKLSIGSFDFGSLIKEEFGRFGGLEDGVYGFMNFYFARRLSLCGVQIDTVVDWHENQGQDRGWNYGFQMFYPKIKIIGYNMSYTSNWFLAISPLPSERENVLPKKVILTPSRYLKKVIQKNDSMIKVETTGSFRYTKIKRRIGKSGPLRILVPLAHKINASLNTISKVRELLKECESESLDEYKIKFKPHPAIPIKELQNFQNSIFGKDEEWTDQALSSELKWADLVLGEWTSALLESFNAGITVGVIRSKDGLFIAPYRQVLVQTGH